MKHQGREFVSVVGAFPPPTTGAAIVTDRMTKLLSRFGAVDVVRFVRPPDRGNGSAVWSRAVSMLLAVRSVLRRGCASLYIALPGGASILALFPALAAARLRNLPIYLHHHSYAPIDEHSAVAAIFFKLAGPRSTHVALCPSMASSLRDRYCAQNTYVVSNFAWVDSPPTRTLNQDGDRLTIGHLSNLSFEKGLAEVIDAFTRLRSQDDRIHLKLGGPCTTPAEEDAVAKAEALEGVDYIGPVRQEELGDFFQDIGVFFFPSRYRNEALPLVVVEALTHGVPCVTSPVGCLPDIDGDGVSVRSVASMDSAIIDYLRVPPNTESVQQRAEAIASESRGDAEALAQRIVRSASR